MKINCPIQVRFVEFRNILRCTFCYLIYWNIILYSSRYIEVVCQINVSTQYLLNIIIKYIDFHSVHNTCAIVISDNWYTMYIQIVFTSQWNIEIPMDNIYTRFKIVTNNKEKFNWFYMTIVNCFFKDKHCDMFKGTILSTI